jgi:hydrogenase-4 component F
MIGSSMAKALLFFVSGNLLIAYGSKRIADVSGVLRRLPASGMLLVMGFFALTGVPPFATFMSELALLRGAVMTGRPWVAGALVVIQIVIFIGLVTRIMGMAQGEPPTQDRTRESVWLILPPAALLVLVLGLGVYLAPPLERVLRVAAATLGSPSP